MVKSALAGCVVILMLFLSGCGESGGENSFDTIGQGETHAVTITVTEAPDAFNSQRELATLAMDSDSAFYLEDAASATIQGQGSQINFSTISDQEFAQGPYDPVVVFLWNSSRGDWEKPFMKVEKIGQGFGLLYDEETVFDGEVYVFIINNGYQGDFGNVSAIVRIDDTIVNQFDIDTQFNSVTDDMVAQGYGTSPQMIAIDGTYRTSYWVDLESPSADPMLIPALVWWPDNESPIGYCFPYDEASGFYYEGPAVSSSSSTDLNLADEVKYLFFLMDSRVVRE